MTATELVGTFDAKVWTNQFFKHNPKCNIPYDIVLGWFANALMSGYDQPIIKKMSRQQVIDRLEVLEREQRSLRYAVGQFNEYLSYNKVFSNDKG